MTDTNKTEAPQLTEQEKQADLEAETARMSPEALDGPQSVAQAARELRHIWETQGLEAMNKALRALAEQEQG